MGLDGTLGVLPSPGSHHPQVPVLGPPRVAACPEVGGRAGSPLAAHVKQEDVEAGAALLHLPQHPLHAQAVLGRVGAGCINGHHEAVAKIFIAVPSIVEQTCRGNRGQVTWWHPLTCQHPLLAWLHPKTPPA